MGVGLCGRPSMFVTFHIAALPLEYQSSVSCLRICLELRSSESAAVSSESLSALIGCQSLEMPCSSMSTVAPFLEPSSIIKRFVIYITTRLVEINNTSLPHLVTLFGVEN